MKQIQLTNEEINLLLTLLAKLMLNTPTSNSQEILDNAQNVTHFRFKLSEAKEIEEVK